MLRFFKRLFFAIFVGVVVYTVTHRNDPAIRNLTTPVSDIHTILADPSRWADKPVRVRGVVGFSGGAWSAGIFTLNQDNGSQGDTVYVATSHGLPVPGSVVEVSGLFRQAAAVGAFQVPLIVAD